MKIRSILQTTSLSIAMALACGNVLANDDFKITTKGGLKIEKTDGTASFAVGGRIQWDYDHTETDVDEEETLEIRRARLFAKGHIDDWAYKAEFNVGEDNGGTVEDLYVSYTGWGKQAILTIGKHREPIGLEDQTSSNDISLLERSAITESYAIARNAGVQLSGQVQDLYYAVGVYRNDNDEESIEETAITGRVAYAPINEEGKLLHIGAAYRAGEESDVVGLELAGVLGQAHAQFEFFDRDESNQDGSYLQVGYVISGTPRPYKDGKFKRVNPTEGWGIEVAARVENGYGKYSDIGLESGEGKQTSFGVNLYPNNNLRFGLDYTFGELDNSDNDGSELRVRTQFVF